MRERLYVAGYPATPLGWVGFLVSILVGIAGTLLLNSAQATALIGLILLSWLVNLLTAYWPLQARLLCHLSSWVILWRGLLPDQPGYLVLPLSALLAGAVVWEQERRRNEQDR